MGRGIYGASTPPRRRLPPGRPAASTSVGAQRLARPGEDNFGFVDRFTAGHAAFGILGGLARLPWWAMLGSGLVWDLVIERKFKDLWPEIWPNSTQDTWANITGDTIAMMLGWKLANMLPEGKKPTHTTISQAQADKERKIL